MDRLTPSQRHQFATDLATIARRWRARLDERLKGSGVSQPLWLALFWLAQARQGASLSELAELTGIEPPTLVRVIDELEGQDLVERSASPVDRRVKHLYLTPKAGPLISRIEDVAETLRREIMADISRDEFETVMAVFAKVRSTLC